MPTNEELDHLVAKTEELMKQFEECQQIRERHQAAREQLAQQLGTTPDEFSAACQRAINHLLKNGSPEQKKLFEQVEAKVKSDHEQALAEIKARVERQVASESRAGNHKHVHNMV